MNTAITPEKERYLYYRNLLKGTYVEEYMSDQYPFAYVETETVCGDIHFVAFTTGYSRTVTIAFVEVDGKIYPKAHVSGNMSGYSIFLSENRREVVEKTFSVGVRTERRYNLRMELKDSNSYFDYGCCCN